MNFLSLGNSSVWRKIKKNVRGEGPGGRKAAFSLLDVWRGELGEILGGKRAQGGWGETRRGKSGLRKSVKSKTSGEKDHPKVGGRNG